MDYLAELCTKLGIELVYTDDDYTALSASAGGKKVSISADILFRGCPEKVAKAVIGYYTESGSEDSYLKAITNYIHDNVVTVEYTIESPDDKFKDALMKHTGSGTPGEAKTHEDSPQKSTTPGKKTSKAKTSGSKTPGSKTAGRKTTKASASKAGMPNDSTSSLVELKIASMTKKSFYGGAVKVSPNEAIEISSDDVVELDIEIDDSEI